VADLSLETLGAADAPALLAVTRSIGWPYTLADWHTVLAAGIAFGYRARDSGVAASAVIFPHGPALTSIGMVIVTPPYRGRGLASALMRRCLTHLPAPTPPSMLIATAAGFPIYRRLGFTTVDHVRKLTARPRVPDPSPGGARGDIAPLAPSALAAAYHLDAEATGADRSLMLRARLAQGQGALIRRADGAATGFGLATKQGDVLVVGPLIGGDPEAAAALVAHLRASHGGPVRADVPAGQTRLLGLLADQGFEGDEVAPVMLLGAARLPGRRDQVFGAATLAFG
jgi:GNAT superfamily N-acetyltransferase